MAEPNLSSDMANLSTVPPYKNVKNKDFPPLSDQPIQPGQVMSNQNPVDDCKLEKQTPRPTNHKGTFKPKSVDELNRIIPESDQLTKSGLYQAKHTKAITAELRHLLNYEKKILEQLVSRAEKFSKLKDEIKGETEKWISEHKKKMAECDDYLTKLIEIPDNQKIMLKGVKGPVEQKILFDLVTKTCDAANNVLVQLSMEGTIVNEVDLSLGELKKHSAVMLKQINIWEKMLKVQDCYSQAVIDKWNELKHTAREVGRGIPDEEEPEEIPAVTQAEPDHPEATEDYCKQKIREIKKGYEDRLKQIERALKQIEKEDCPECLEEIVGESASAGIS